jgi:hypothetical protein
MGKEPKEEAVDPLGFDELAKRIDQIELPEPGPAKPDMLPGATTEKPTAPEGSGGSEGNAPKSLRGASLRAGRLALKQSATCSSPPHSSSWSSCAI